MFQGQDEFAWFYAELDEPRGASAGSGHRLLFDLVRENATIYLNGKKVGAHQGRNPFGVDLTDAWRQGGPNELAVLVESSAGQGGLLQDVTLVTVPPESAVELTGWTLRGGNGVPAPDFDRDTLPAATGGPVWYHATFNACPPMAVGPHPILRLATDGLSRGSVYLNGHCVGRYPDPTPVHGIYLPEAWLNNVANAMLVFDEQGASPAKAVVVVEEAASRMATVFTLMLR